MRRVIQKALFTGMSTEQQYTYYPLTLYDAMFKDAAVVMGWLVEGLLDIRKLEAALNRLVTKWPMLAGRLEITDVCLILCPQLTMYCTQK